MRFSIFFFCPQILLQGLSLHGALLGCLLTWSLPLAAVQPQTAPQKVLYPGAPRQEYYIDLLQLALSYPCAGKFQLQASGLDLPKKRAFDLMNARQGIDVMYGSASKERIAEYRAVPFPIMRGLMGLRVALVSNEGIHTLQHVYTQAALARLRVGQFSTWSDTAILQANQFNVETGSDIDGWGSCRSNR